MNFRSREEVIQHFEECKHQISPEAQDALVAFHDSFPVDGGAPTREQLQDRLKAAWYLARQASRNRGEQHRRMAQVVTVALGLDGVARTRRIVALYLVHGMRATNSAALDLALEPIEPCERLRALEARTVQKARAPHPVHGAPCHQGQTARTMATPTA